MTLSPADLRAQANSPWDQHTPAPIRHLTNEKIDELLTRIHRYFYNWYVPQGAAYPDELRAFVERWYYQQATGAE